METIMAVDLETIAQELMKSAERESILLHKNAELELAIKNLHLKEKDPFAINSGDENTSELGKNAEFDLDNSPEELSKTASFSYGVDDLGRSVQVSEDTSNQSASSVLLAAIVD